MLEVKNLSKVYSGKGGVTVKALDDVSVVFPEKGMVFLLGKSGSGKSTLLNVCGGLDKPDDGEIIVKGKSSKDFSASDFDSYRNTFIGFVFQEYNILNEFTIEQNIALALQLQSKPNDKAAVAALLEQVDLAGYAKRKPNTLSGGQKQRVAIARALIKEPEIIMADEPTGALDSATGKQVLDTLKKLSEHKLVIVVSHDREFAEQYGDRIIELKDGKIISDVTKVYNAPKDIAGEAAAELPNVAMVSEDTIAIRKGEDLTDDDVKKIAELLRKKGGEAIITADAHDLPGVKRACKINENGDKESFKETVPPTPVAYDGSKTKFIKSKLPLGHAIKMGASGLKSKPIRLIFTILLAVAAFVLFGVVSTFMLYDPDYSVSEALKEADYPNVLVDKHYSYVRKSYRVDYATGEETLDYADDADAYTRFSPSEIKAMSVSGLNYAGVYTFNNNTYDNNATFSIALETEGNNFRSVSVNRDLQDYYCYTSCTGFSDCGKEYLTGNGFTVEGRYPAKAEEVMLSSYMAALFVNTDGCGLDSETDMIGKKIRISSGGMDTVSFTVTGIVKTGEIPSKYDELKRAGNSLSERDREALKTPLSDYLSHGFETLIYVSGDFYDFVSKRMQAYNNNTVYLNSIYARKIRVERYSFDDTTNLENYGTSFITDKTLEKNKQLVTVRNFDGTVRTDYKLGENEAFISENAYNNVLDNYLSSHYFDPIYDPEAYEELNADGKFDYYLADRETRIAAAKKWYSVLAFRQGLYDFASSYLYWDVSNKTQWDLTEAEQAFLAGIQKVDGVDEAAAVASYVAAHEQSYYGILAERQMNNRGWEYIFVAEDPYTVVEKLKAESYSAEDFASIKATLDDWFAKDGFSTDVSVRFTLNYDSANTWGAVYYLMPKTERAFLTVLEKIRTYVSGSYDKTEDIALLAPTDEDWDALYAYTKAHTQRYYGWMVEYLNNMNQAHPFTDPDKDYWSVVSDLKYGNYSDEDFTALKGRIDAWIASNGASTEAKENYTFDISKATSDLYYCDKYGRMGTLSVVGYIEKISNDYCVADGFIKEHAEIDGTYYYETYETDYVAPADARYNKLISLTDNSMAQVAAAQAKDEERSVFYRINNEVVDSLNYFLEMILDLEKIFLYVGLGVGVLAAFFLLNFISVSISTKRKDIGILRAVGARGSDVFKIFYAEAFLIAFICFVLASVGSFVLCMVLNQTLVESISISLLHFGPINIALIFGISVFVSVIATFLPVYFAAKKSPVESIRAL
ncbi:MAG: ABC transporter ATP-binding protein/permease [Clostridia bacterium]|nr:ABC transporter ATP-binding protein/permease [Clostridia bacterium]